MTVLNLSSIPSHKLDLIKRVAFQANALKMSAYLVGGFVRDSLLLRASDDIDIAIVGDALDVVAALMKAHGGKATLHKKFKTAVWHYKADEHYIDLTSTRKESYSFPAALPSVNFSNLQDDLARRDFSINTLAMSLNADNFGELFDFHNAQKDLENKIIRVLHKNSFIDDPTRLFRAVRYEQRYGFQIDSATIGLIPAALKHIRALSAARVLRELDLILGEPKALAMLSRLSKLGILNAVADELIWEPNHAEQMNLAFETSPESGWGLEENSTLRRDLAYALWLGGLNLRAIDNIHKRLKFPAALINIIRETARLKDDLQSMQNARPSEWTIRLEEAPLVSVYANYLMGKNIALKEFALNWRYVQPKTNGESLKAKGLKPSPRYKKILLALRTARLDGSVVTDEQENNLLDSLMKREQ